MAKKSGEYERVEPTLPTYTPGRTPRFQTADEVRFVIECLASGEMPCNETTQWRAIEKLAELTGLTYVAPPPKDEGVGDKPNLSRMTVEELAAFIAKTKPVA